MPTDQPIPPPPSGGNENETTDPGVHASRTPRPTARDTLIGKVLDQRYRILGLVARGGMGRVYAAEQAPMGRKVAVKVLDVGLEHDEDQEFRSRFIKEAETSARLTHPNTVRVFDYGKTWDDVLYIAMEYLEGRNLYQVLQTDAPMDARRVARIGRQIASSLREAHGLGLIHRDLKPSNIILTRPGGDEEFVKVVDFGLVKEIRVESELTRDDALVGSPSYMSPEQIRSAALDERSDIYSLGVLLYACLTGRAPFTGATSLNVLMGHLNQPPPPMASVCPSMKRAPALEAIVMRCLAKAPADRYPSMESLLHALQACEEALRGTPTPVMAEPTFTGIGTGPVPPVAPPKASRAAPPPAGHVSDVSLILPRPGPSARLIAGIGVGTVFLLVLFVLVLAAGAWLLGGLGAEEAPPATVSTPLTPVAPPTAAAPVAPPSAAPAATASAAPAATESAATAPAPSAQTPAREPRRPRAPIAATAGASAPPASPAAAPSDTPPAPQPAPTPEPAHSGNKVGSDVRDPWEKR